ncbi:MAG TPA: hypothetical protein VFZ01_09035 [Geminicoccaceae bacterium]
MRRVITAGLSFFLLGGCGLGEGVGSWRDAAFGLVTDDEFTTLETILVSAEDTPGSQSLLYTAMVEAEAAYQSASRAVASSAEPAALGTAVGEVIYAIEPDAAPAWDAKTAGLVPGWTGRGYGLLNATGQMADGLRRVQAEGGGEAEAAAEALVCIENTAGFARDALALAQSILAGVDGEEQAALLPQLELLTRAQLAGLDADGDGEIELGDGECALQQAEKVLEPLSLDLERRTS